MKFIFKKSLIVSLCIFLFGCDGFFDKDNMPTPTALQNITQTVTPKLVWSTKVNAGAGKDYLKLVPSYANGKIFTAGHDGLITATDVLTGKTIWSQQSNAPVSSGPAVNSDALFVGTQNGLIIALSQSTGKVLWNKPLPSEVLAPPSASQNVVLVKTIDGQLTALSASNGDVLWHAAQTEPAFILRGGSSPVFDHDNALVGFANGNLVKYALHSGSVVWQQTIMMPQGSFAIQRMVDINCDPYISGNKIYAATYQGKIAALNLQTGGLLWSHTLSSFTGLAADANEIFVSDAKSILWAFSSDNGQVLWKQSQLAARNISAPAVLGKYLLVGDKAGYLHWLSVEDGHFVGRSFVNGSGIMVAPLVINNKAYVYTQDGHLAAYSVDK